MRLTSTYRRYFNMQEPNNYNFTVEEEPSEGKFGELGYRVATVRPFTSETVLSWDPD